MQFPNLLLLRAGFSVSLVTSFILLTICIGLTYTPFSCATDPGLKMSADHDHPIILDAGFEDMEEDLELVISRPIELAQRQTGASLYLSNNQPQNRDISSGQLQSWVFTKQSIEGPAGERGKGLPKDQTSTSKELGVKQELRKRQSQKRVYITINTCLQPLSNVQFNSSNYAQVIPPQLALFYSQSSANQNPGPDATGQQQNVTVDQGYALVNITSDTDIYIGVAGMVTTGFTGSWNYEIAASIDAPYHAVEEDDPFLHFVDGDTHAALLITDDLTNQNPNSTVYQEWMSMTPPFGLMGIDQQDPSILGVSKSYCGLMHNAKIMANLQNVQNQNVASMTDRGLGGKPKEQFYITSLDASSAYWGFLAMQGNSTASGLDVIGGGGKVWPAVNFSTKAESNCALMYNLSFCSEVAYAVPTNPNLFSPRDGLPELAQLYDNNAQAFYQLFNYSLQQIPCNASASAQYSLARSCDDCARAYKQWLCAVTIPRCDDFNNNATYLKPRNVAQPFPNGTILPNTPDTQFFMNRVASNQSRNSLIDNQIQPGPYKEVLPCIDLCYDLVQSCPAALGFGCPSSGAGMEDSYGQRSDDPSLITCSYLGAAYYLSAGHSVLGSMNGLFVIALAVALGVFMSM